MICPNSDCNHLICCHDEFGCTMLDCNCEEKADPPIDPLESEPQPEEQAA